MTNLSWIAVTADNKVTTLVDLLKEDDRGQQVADLQRALSRFGYAADVTNGEMPEDRCR